MVADTTALMTAVYSDQVFGDVSLYRDALLEHTRYRLTLLTGLDLPWMADRPRWRWLCRRCGDGGCEAPGQASAG